MTYLAPTSLDDALNALGGSDVQIIAGGTDWYPAQGERPVRCTLLDISRICGLRGISRDGAGWRIGAATTWSDISRADLPPAFDALKAAAREVGSIQIQNAGTIAGNLCNASPAADGVPPLLTLDATVELVGPSGTRRLAIRDFIKGVRDTALGADELVSALHIPAQPDGMRSAFRKLGARKYLVISIAMASAAVVTRAGRIESARVAVGACSPVARRLPGLEEALIGVKLDDVAKHISLDHLADLSPITDVRGSGDYRMEAVASLIARAVQEAAHG